MNPCLQLLGVARHSRVAQKIAPCPISSSLVRLSSSCCNKKKKAIAVMPKGCEEIELMTPIDILRRGGVEVVIAGYDGKKPTQSLNCVEMMPDKELSKVFCEKFDAVILTGDDDAVKKMSKCKQVEALLTEQEKNCRIIAAICSAPLVLMAHCIGKDKCITSHPDCAKKIKECGIYKYAEKLDVVVDEYLITARGPAQAMQWALTILMHLTDEQNACCIAKALLVK